MAAPPPMEAVTAPPPASLPPAPPQASRADSAALGAFAAIASILAARFLLLLALIGAFVLACYAMQSQTYAGLAVMIAYCTLAVLPLVYLDIQSRRPGA